MTDSKKSSKESFVCYAEEWHTLTLTIADEKLQFFHAGNAKNRATAFMSFMSKFLQPIGRYAFYELYLECSRKGRLHLHGIIKPRDSLTFLLSIPPMFEKLGFYEIDTIDDMKLWKVYYTKQSGLWSKMFANEDDSNYVLRFNTAPLHQNPIEDDSDGAEIVNVSVAEVVGEVTESPRPLAETQSPRRRIRKGRRTRNTSKTRKSLFLKL